MQGCSDIDDDVGHVCVVDDACHVDELMEKEWVGDVDGVGEIDDDDGGGGDDDDDNDDAGTMVQKMQVMWVMQRMQ